MTTVILAAGATLLVIGLALLVALLVILNTAERELEGENDAWLGADMGGSFNLHDGSVSK